MRLYGKSGIELPTDPVIHLLPAFSQDPRSLATICDKITYPNSDRSAPSDLLASLPPDAMGLYV